MEISVREAVKRFIERKETDSADRTVKTYEDRLEHFIAFCEDRDIEAVSDITPRDIDDYGLNRRRQGYRPATIKGQLATLRVFLKHIARVDYVDDAVPEAVEVPNLDREEESSDTRLAPDDATALLDYFRDSRARFGTPHHALLELLWHTGCRMGGARALDMEDFHPDEQFVEFRHRPDTGTPLKNKYDGERLVGLSEPVVEALEAYIIRERADKRDEHGREPLLCARQGRPSFATLRAWAYLATQPCLHQQCPHGRERHSCSWVHRNHASKCPSSRSPHPIRTGSITWQLNQGLDVGQVADRVNASADVIKRHYDKQSEREEFEERRRETSTALDINSDPEEDETDE
jgi:site-specific recombinase XerD